MVPINMKRTVIIILFLCSGLVYASSLDFKGQTPLNNTWTYNTSIQVNVSISLNPNIDTYNFNWANINYSIYEPSLIASYNFNNNPLIGENGSYIVDISSKHSDLSCTSCPIYSKGVYSNGVFFNGNNYLTSLNLSLAEGSNFTILLWFNDTATDVNPRYLCSWGSSIMNMSGTYLGNLSEGRSVIQQYNGVMASSFVISPNSYTNIWHHLGVVYNGTGTQFYLDGISVNATTYTLSYPFDFSTGAIHIGSRVDNNPIRLFIGEMDEFRIYNRVLSGIEILLEHDSEFQKYNSSQYYFYNNITNLVQGTYNYYGWANDSGGTNFNTETRSVHIIDYPSISSCSINPAPANSSQNLSVNATGTVGSGLTGNWTYNWFKNNAVITGQTSINLSNGNFTSNDNITAECTLNDSYTTNTLNSSTLTIGDAIPPTLKCWMQTTSGYTDTAYNAVYCNCSDTNYLSIDSPRVDFLDPNTDRRGNYTLLNEANNTYYKSYTFSLAGTYIDFNFYCADGSGNLAQNTTNNFSFISSTRPSVIQIGGGGGGGSSTVLEKLNLSLKCVNGVTLNSGESITCTVTNIGDKATQVTLFLVGNPYTIAGQSTNSKDFILMMPKEGAINLPIGGSQAISLVENLPQEADLVKTYDLTLSIIGSNSDTFTVPIHLRWSKTGQTDMWTWLSQAYWKGVIDIGGGQQVLSIPNFVPIAGLLGVILVAIPNALKRKKR
jgi:hypothetical protein